LTHALRLVPRKGFKCVYKRDAVASQSHAPGLGPHITGACNWYGGLPRELNIQESAALPKQG